MEVININDIFGTPQAAQVQLSPDGSKFAFLSELFGKANIFVKSFDESMSTFITRELEGNISSFTWASNTRFVYSMDNGGDLHTKLYGMDIDGSGYTELTPFDDVTASIITSDKQRANHLLISMNNKDKARSDVYSMDFNTGDLHLVLENPGNIFKWLKGSGGIFGGIYYNRQKKGIAIYRDGEFLSIFATSAADILKVLRTGRDTYILTDNGAQFVRLASITEDGALTEIHSRDGFDTEGVIWTEGGLPGGVIYEPDGRETDFFDPKIEEKYRNIGMYYPDANIDFMGRKGERELYYIHSDKMPPIWIVWYPGENYPDIIAEERRNIDEQETFSMEFAMAEGKIPCYLTFPNGSRKGHKMIVQPHGGPFSRTYKDWKERAQFLAGLGYLVMHVNFRGSTGYGRKHREAGYRAWGTIMQEDIITATKWAIEKGYADPEKIGILGSSFGGYSALWALIRHSDMFRCAVAICPVTDLIDLWENPRPEELLLEGQYEIELGRSENVDLKAQSPITFWQEIDRPLFLAHSENDSIVPISHSERFGEFIRHEDFHYYIIENDGHLLSDGQNRVDLYYQIKDFLGKHL